jgi:formylglycine-generating enzyme required for sulfatase activity
VGSLPPNAFGLHEMTGNTWEWCGDTLDEDDDAGASRNARGGTYEQAARRARTADRSSFASWHRDHDLGLRVLMEWRAVPAEGTRNDTRA